MKKMTIEELENIANEAKLLKSEYIIFTENNIIGTDQFKSCIRITNNPTYTQISFTMKYLTDFIKMYCDGDNITLLDNDIVLSDKDGNIIMSMPINFKLKDIDVLDIVNRIVSLGYNDCVYDLSNNEEFMTANSNRVADGMKMVKLDYNTTPLFITVFGGYIPINKGDTVEGRLYYDELSPTFNMKYIIHKKKGNRVIEMYSKYLKL